MPCHRLPRRQVGEHQVGVVAEETRDHAGHEQTEHQRHEEKDEESRTGDKKKTKVTALPLP